MYVSVGDAIPNIHVRRVAPYAIILVSVGDRSKRLLVHSEVVHNAGV